MSHPILRAKRTFGQKAADILTGFVGSWFFIIITILIIILWVILNGIWLIFGRAWDPFPFILLNLTLSTLAALQAPIILMSQNRQAQKDRIRTEYDYAVDRKAEKEIQGLKNQLERIEKKLK